MPLRRFALYDGLGAVLWVGAYIGTGYVFSGELEDAASPKSLDAPHDYKQHA